MTGIQPNKISLSLFQLLRQTHKVNQMPPYPGRRTVPGRQQFLLLLIYSNGLSCRAQHFPGLSSPTISGAQSKASEFVCRDSEFPGM